MNAPEPAANLAPKDAMVVPNEPIEHFAPSLTNDNRHPEAYIAELAESIRQVGIIQPVTARPWPSSRDKAPKGVVYEIVVGEGRFLAAKKAGLVAIPFFWRDLSDEQALLLQLIENLKRNDLSEIQEAKGYQRLMKDHGYTADRVAADIGKSRSHVYGRLKLLDLCPGALAVVQEHKLEATIAVLVARIPDAKLQAQAAKEVACGRYGNSEPMSYRAAAEHIQRTFMLKLAEAPFPRADTELVPGAGRCHECPKRTGNARELFDDVKSADVCTDPSCYQAKVSAHIKRQQELAKAEGRKIIKGEDAKKLKPNYYSDIKGGYVDLDKTVHVGGKAKTVRQILGADAPKADLLMDPHQKDNLIEVVSIDSVRAQLEAKGIAAQVLPARAGKSDKEKAEQKAAKLREKIDTTFSERLFDRIRSRVIQDIDDKDSEAPYLEIEEERMVAQRLFDLTNYGLQGKVARVWLSPKDGNTSDYQLVKELQERIETMDRKEIAKLMLDLTLIDEAGRTGTPDRMLNIAKNMGLDADALKVEIRKELTPKDKPKPTAKKAKAQPPTAEPQAPAPDLGPIVIGDRVRINANAKSAIGAPQVGKTGKTTYMVGKAFMVAIDGTNGSQSFMPDELDKLPPAAPSTPTKAAQAGEKNATKPAAPAKTLMDKAVKPKTKSNPAPAAPANEPATPVKTTPLTNATQAWPFPVGNRPEAPTANVTEALEAAGQERLVP
jgi:ParB/RepB/Spo0J family partition protein